MAAFSGLTVEAFTAAGSPVADRYIADLRAAASLTTGVPEGGPQGGLNVHAYVWCARSPLCRPAQIATRSSLIAVHHSPFLPPVLQRRRGLGALGAGGGVPGCAGARHGCDMAPHSAARRGAGQSTLVPARCPRCRACTRSRRPQIVVKIISVTPGARRKLLNSINVQTQMSVDAGSTPQEAAQALNAVTTVTQQMTEVSGPC